MKKEQKFLRLCSVCRQYMGKDNLVRITRNHKTGEIVVNSDNLVQGRSIYVCKNEDCIKKFIKNKKSLRSFGAEMPENIKEELCTVLKR